jgi:hypothetical protein
MRISAFAWVCVLGGCSTPDLVYQEALDGAPPDATLSDSPSSNDGAGAQDSGGGTDAGGIDATLPSDGGVDAARRRAAGRVEHVSRRRARRRRALLRRRALRWRAMRSARVQEVRGRGLHDGAVLLHRRRGQSGELREVRHGVSLTRSVP